jgi:hypothetical protein
VWKKEEYIYHVWGATKIIHAMAEDYRRTGNEESKAMGLSNAQVEAFGGLSVT